MDYIRWNQQHEVKVGIGTPKMQEHTCWAESQRLPNTVSREFFANTQPILFNHTFVLQKNTTTSTQPHPNHNKIGATENMINPLYNNNAAILIFGGTFLYIVS
jgi:hypothetical protein